MNNDDVRQHLSGDRLHIFVATLVGLALAVYAGLFAVGYGGNPVKSLMLLLGGASMVIASLRPRIGLALLVITSAYLDLIKRLLVCFGMSSMSDVTDARVSSNALSKCALVTFFDFSDSRSAASPARRTRSSRSAPVNFSVRLARAPRLTSLASGIFLV